MLRLPPPLLLLPVVWLACPAPAPSTSPEPGDAQAGQALYAAQCAGCHGPGARGGLAVALVPVAVADDALVGRIAATMPPDDATRCDTACARDITAWLHTVGDEGEPATCDTFPPSPRQLRLLTRREYANTVRDLFGAGGKACNADAECQLATESCVASRCAADACGVTTFVWKANGRRPASVHVAGTFNGWAPTVAGGGWAMAYVAQGDLYFVKRTVPVGTHQYKFVVDGQWLPDADNPNRAPDTYGGQNSVLTVQCNGTSPAPAGDVTATFPLETRPQGYPFDNNAEAGLVTAAHVEAYLAAATTLATKAPAVSPCRPGGDARPCAEAFVQRFGRKAYRRPLTSDETTRYVGLALGERDFDAGLTRVAEAMLSSPHFLYRSELGEPQADGTWRLTPYEVASALSYGLWATTPDDALLDAAAQGRLSTGDDVAREARRLLGDSRARKVVRAFALQWLGVERVGTVDKSPALFPDFTPALRTAMALETQALVEHVVFDGTGRFDELLTADYSFVDGPLAPLYGMAAGAGTQRRAVPAERAAGVLATAACWPATPTRTRRRR